MWQNYNYKEKILYRIYVDWKKLTRPTIQNKIEYGRVQKLLKKPNLIGQIRYKRLKQIGLIIKVELLVTISYQSGNLPGELDGRQEDQNKNGIKTIRDR